MRKYLIAVSLLVLLGMMLCFGDINFERSLYALRLWFETLVPSLFVIMVLVKVLFAFHCFDWLMRPLAWLIAPLLGIGKHSMSYVAALMLLGFPAGAAFIDQEVAMGRLNEAQGKRLVYTCSFATPGFVIMTLGSVLFGNVKIGLVLFVIQLLAAFVLLLLTRKQIIPDIGDCQNVPPFVSTLKTAMLDSGKALYMMGGYLMLCISICGVLLPFFPAFLQTPLAVITEFSSGCVSLAALSLSLPLRLMLISMLLSFGGLCVHMQVISMSEHIALSYGTYLCFRILQSAVTGIIAYVLFFMIAI